MCCELCWGAQAPWEGREEEVRLALGGGAVEGTLWVRGFPARVCKKSFLVLFHMALVDAEPWQAWPLLCRSAGPSPSALGPRSPPGRQLD